MLSVKVQVRFFSRGHYRSNYLIHQFNPYDAYCMVPLYRSLCVCLQEAMEDVYIHHLPHLCWYTLQTLCSQEPVAVKSRSLLHCLELIMFCVQKMLQEPSTPSLSTSLPTTPALTPMSPSLTGTLEKRVYITLAKKNSNKENPFHQPIYNT